MKLTYDPDIEHFVNIASAIIQGFIGTRTHCSLLDSSYVSLLRRR